MTIDFDNDEQYRKFVADVAACVADYYCADFIEVLADELIFKPSLREKLVNAIFDKLIAQHIQETNHAD